METFTVGDVVIVPFPYADFSVLKKRPALVVAYAEFNNLILCQITSNPHASKRALSLTDNDFKSGSLRMGSFVRPDKLFTIERSLIVAKSGSLKGGKLSAVKTKLRQLFE